MFLTSFGQMARKTAQFIYRNNRRTVDALVRTGKIAPEDADKEWAKLVARDMAQNGLDAPKNIRKLMK